MEWDIGRRLLGALVKGVVAEGRRFSATRLGKRTARSLEKTDALRNLRVIWTLLGAEAVLTPDVPTFDVRCLLSGVWNTRDEARLEEAIMSLIETVGSESSEPQFSGDTGEFVQQCFLGLISIAGALGEKRAGDAINGSSRRPRVHSPRVRIRGSLLR